MLVLPKTEEAYNRIIDLFNAIGSNEPLSDLPRYDDILDIPADTNSNSAWRYIRLEIGDQTNYVEDFISLQLNRVASILFRIKLVSAISSLYGVEEPYSQDIDNHKVAVATIVENIQELISYLKSGTAQRDHWDDWRRDINTYMLESQSIDTASNAFTPQVVITEHLEGISSDSEGELRKQYKRDEDFLAYLHKENAEGIITCGSEVQHALMRICASQLRIILCSAIKFGEYRIDFRHGSQITWEQLLRLPHTFRRQKYEDMEGYTRSIESGITPREFHSVDPHFYKLVEVFAPN